LAALFAKKLANKKRQHEWKNSTSDSNCNLFAGTKTWTLRLKALKPELGKKQHVGKFNLFLELSRQQKTYISRGEDRTNLQNLG
jgi:hypothetical protein